MQALAAVGLQEGSARLRVVPRYIGRAGFHGREDRHQAGVLPAPGPDFFHPVLLAEVAFAATLDLQARFGRQTLRVLPQLIPERLGETEISEIRTLRSHR